ncbi:hypothetical protein [Paenibacillus sp. BC26]|uniref:hypothetical protein n=1 Tax=Paenibacillus sp. BC26 TaxID=1881032 RepID=UPI0008E30204|nr:hypothetical protein [Paenibacillus sp. BC26]SFS83846.1 hypothetical protein SAMN05428962_3165 [Paenibacillus sp. BC26]
MNKVTIRTRNEVLIGVIVEPDMSSIFGSINNGIWIRREKKISFIAHSEIIEIKPTTIFDKEIDNR